ncbi:PTS glucose/sucrose transporter subunit IIB [Escherichia coli]|uniref:PTS glucose/sucrose transporter subunit IIB n=1 Tax=Escherichia coli TaxID=562 RepID=UPI002284824F|nr:PTS glucose/sucrose transporter subunit IIB [Escherichia coli]MCY9497260.1 PTS glucose/sucrose transporter subunit IIB [Escherichia coli]
MDGSRAHRLSFSGGLIDYLFFGVLPERALTGPWCSVGCVGACTNAPVYLWPSSAGISDARGVKSKKALYARKTKQKRPGERIILAYGGLGNMTRIEACMSRLRIDVTDKSLVDKALLKQLGAAGVVEVGNNIQSVFGMKSDRLKEAIRAANAYTQEAK